MIDLGVVDVEFPGCAMSRPGAEERVDQDVEVLAQIVAGFYHIATVAVDPGGEVRPLGFALVDDEGTLREVAHPERVRLIVCSAAANLLLADPQLATCRTLESQVPIERATGNGSSELRPKNTVEDYRAEAWLFLLEFDGAFQEWL